MDPRYAKKYTVNIYPRWYNRLIKVNLWKKDYTGTITTLIGAKNALTIKGPSFDIEAPIKTRGGTLRLISNGDRDLLDLYTASPMDWIIEIINGNGATLFLGYLESELYEEPFGRNFNYEVVVQFNDMLPVLARLPYVDEDGEPYRGFSSMFTILNRILSKLSRSHASLDYTGVNRSYINDAYILTIAGSQQSNPTSMVFMHKVIFNSDNYIDEDGISYSCKRVLEMVMSSQSMCMTTFNDRFRIIEPFMFRVTANPDFRVRYTFNTTTNTFNTTNNGFTPNINGIYFYLGATPGGETKRTDFKILDASFTIVSGFNKYILEKNRYIKPIIEPENFDGDAPSRVFKIDQYSFDPYFSQVTGPGGPGRSDYVLYWKKWIAVYDSFGEGWQGIFTDMLNMPIVASTNFYKFYPVAENTNPKTVSFYGGIKDVLVVDGVQINWDADDRDFINYLFINNPTEPYDGNNTDAVSDYTKTLYDHNITTIGKVAATYTAYVPYVYSSDKVLLHFYFTGMMVKIASAVALPGGSIPAFSTSLTDSGIGSYYIYMARIFAIDNVGNKIAYLKNSAINVTTSSDSHPDINGFEIPKTGYVWAAYLGTETFHALCCKIPHVKQNEAFNPQHIDNMDIHIDIYANAAPVTTIYSIQFEFTNLYYEVNQWSVDNPTFHLKAYETLKQSNIYYGIRDIGINVVTKDTLEELPYEDEELQFYLSEIYKTEEKKEDFHNYTGDDTFITDVGGYMIETATANELVPITSVTSAASTPVTFANMEQMRGEQLLRHYEQSRIQLSMSLKSGLPNDPAWYGDYMSPAMMTWQSAFAYPDDAKWGAKKFAVIDFDLNLDSGILNVTLEEYK